MKKLQGSYSRFLTAIKYLDEKEVYKRLRFNDKRDIYTRLGFREVHNGTLDKLVKLYPIINKEYLYEGKGKVNGGLKYSKRLSKALKGKSIRNSDIVVRKILKDRYQLLPGPIMDRICKEYNIYLNWKTYINIFLDTIESKKYFIRTYTKFVNDFESFLKEFSNENPEKII
jgi:hypothetical protein